jgi:broad specificity phosphatase PhoE
MTYGGQGVTATDRCGLEGYLMILMRHGQSVFNLLFSETRRDPGIADPELTPLGHEQAREGAKALADEPLTRIIISPYTRALQTAEPVIAVHKVPVTIMSEVRERFAFTCDIGRHKRSLADQFPHHSFAHLAERWWPETTETADATVERAAEFRMMMRQRMDHETTLVVSHWAFILALTGISVANGGIIRYSPHDEAPTEICWRP